MLDQTPTSSIQVNLMIPKCNLKFITYLDRKLFCWTFLYICCYQCWQWQHCQTHIAKFYLMHKCKCSAEWILIKLAMFHKIIFYENMKFIQYNFLHNLQHFVWRKEEKIIQKRRQSPTLVSAQKVNLVGHSRCWKRQDNRSLWRILWKLIPIHPGHERCTGSIIREPWLNAVCSALENFPKNCNFSKCALTKLI